MEYFKQCILLIHTVWMWFGCRCCNSIIPLTPGDNIKITSPNFGLGQRYPKSTDCTWQVISSFSQKLTVIFHQFDVEFHVACAWDYVQINDGSCATTGGQKYCGAFVPAPHTTYSTSVCIRFHSDVVISKPGFNLTVSASASTPSTSTLFFTTMLSTAPLTPELPHIDCLNDISIVSHSATISSPGFGVNPTYPNNIMCVWKVEIQENQMARVTFESFELESHPFCGYDWFKVYDGILDASPAIETFCGHTVPPEVTFSKSTCLRFKSDFIVPKAGFFAKVEIMTLESTSTSSSPTKLPSPPSQTTQSSAESLSPSTTVLSQSSPEGTQSVAAVTQPSVSTTRIYSSPSSAVASPSSSSSTTTKSSSTTMSTSSSSSTTENTQSAMSTFTSASSSSPASSSPPVLSEVEMCKDISDMTDVTTTILVSPNYHHGFYPLSVSCDITIQTAPGQRLFIYFLEFDLELHQTCGWDSLSLFDGSCSSGKDLGRFCGPSLPLNVTTTDNTLCIKFVSDFIVPRSGFKAVIQSFLDTTSFDIQTEATTTSENPVLPLTTTDIETTENPSLFTSKPSHVSKLSTLLSSAPLVSSTLESKSTSIPTSASPLTSTSESTSTLTSASTSTSTSESTSTLTSASTSTSTSTLTSVLMSMTSPSQTPISNQSVTSTTVSFTSPVSTEATTSQSIPSSATPTTVSMCSSNSVTVYSPVVVTSPNFGPGLFYPVSKTCSLRLSASHSQRIHISFIEFDVEYHPHCSWDSLTVYDGNSTSSPILYVLCGGLAQAGNITSSSHNLYLKFVSDFIAPKQGFRAVADVLPQEEASASSTSTATATTHVPSSYTSVSTTSLPGTSSSVITQIPELNDSQSSLSVATTQPVNQASGTASSKGSTSVTASSTSSSSLVMTSEMKTDETSLQTTQTASTSSATDTVLATACSGVPHVLLSHSGVITSPGFPSSYPNNLDCKWIIDVGTHHVVRIVFSSFKLELHKDCSWDSLTVYNGGDVDGDVITKLCGYDIPHNVTSPGSKVLLHLHTDRVIAKSGFNLTYSALQKPTPAGQCGDSHFLCFNGSCLPSYRRCDGHGDCDDNEDEDNCVKLDSDDRNGTLLIMRSGTWFPVCYDHWEDELSDLACVAANHGKSIKVKSVTTFATAFLMPLKDSSGDLTHFHTNLSLGPTCSSGRAVSLTCLPRECGLKSNHLPSAYILGGSRSVRGEWPWVASLMSGTNMVCGATIISESWVVTAGHCVETLINSPQSTYIVVGSVNLKAPDVEYLRVTEIILHPKHNFIYNADIALIHLQRPLVFTDRVKPLCLPTRQHRWSTSLSCYIAGWGVTLRQNSTDTYASIDSDVLAGITSPYLHHAKLKLWQQTKCRDVYSTKIKDSMICAGHDYGKVDACKGDSGSPLMCRTSGDKWEFVGVTSWGEGCGVIGKPGVYTRADHYIDWLNQQTTHTDEVNCDFESPGICGYADTSNTDYIWTRRKGGTYLPERPHIDSTLGNVSGHYMYAFISYEAKNQIATLTSPPFLNSGFSCLTFCVTFLNAKDARLRVYGTSNSSDDPTLLMQLTPLQGQWRLVEHELNNDVMHVLFVAEAGRWTSGGVGIDDVIIKDRRCEGFLKVSCDFDSGTLCEYLQAEDDAFDWNLKPVVTADDDSRAPPGHNTDHYIEADGSNRNPGDKTRVVSPTLNSSVPQCISFQYKIHPANSGTLSVCTESEFEGKVFLSCNRWSRASSVNNDWTEGQAQIPASSYPYRIGFQAERGSVGGIIAIDNLSKKDGVCQL